MNSNKELINKVVLITNGDASFSRKLSLSFARAGAHILLSCSQFSEKTLLTKLAIENENVDCQIMVGNVNDQKYCRELIQIIKKKYGKLDVLVNNNLPPNYPLSVLPGNIRNELISISKMGIFSFQKLTEAAISIMGEGANIINNQILDKTLEMGDLDYENDSSSLRTFTEFYSNRLASKKIKTNAVVYLENLVTENRGGKFKAKWLYGENPIEEQKGCPFLYLASNNSQYFNGKVLVTAPQLNQFPVMD
jgi:NAD(P)-dependent dehydrogenase (short-subunit alcohol dehydrogenase family)